MPQPKVNGEGRLSETIKAAQKRSPAERTPEQLAAELAAVKAELAASQQKIKLLSDAWRFLTKNLG